MTYGCLNRAPLKSSRIVHDGLQNAGFMGHVIRLIEIPDPMTKTCQYQADDKYSDPQCVGCSWKNTKENLK